MTLILAIVALAVPACSADCQQRVINADRREVVRPYRGWIRRVAECESGGNWRANTGNSFFGGLQFTMQSWRAVGGRGYPHRAGKLEQSFRAVRLLKLQGRGAWPNCAG